jgi:hypothetical protein
MWQHGKCWTGEGALSFPAKNWKTQLLLQQLLLAEFFLKISAELCCAIK